MTFCSREQEESQIIKTVTKEGKNYYVEYLDGTISGYNNFEINHLEELEEKMISQAKERQNLEYKNTREIEIKYLIMLLPTLILSNISYNKDLFLLASLSYTVAIISLYQLRKNRKRIKEFKKYKILLKNYNFIKEHPELQEVVEFEPYDQKEINIFNIDDYSLFAMKEVEIEIKKLKKKSKNHN